MKKTIYLFAISLLFISCEDVIEVSLPNTPPRLVIDASINWFKETTGQYQSIRLSLTAPYFNNQVPPANHANVKIIDSNNRIFTFIEEDDTGIYRNHNFNPVLNETYTLSIIYNEEVYTATEVLTPVTSIDFVDQKNNGGFSGNDIELKAYYMDPPNQKNFYLFEFDNSNLPIISLNIYNDEFNDGNQIFAFYSEEASKTGDLITINSYGISERYYQFMSILLQQTDSESGDPFETQPATVRGNCINETNPDNYPLGYFRLSESDQFIYTIE
ncbi:hypothetical protein APS56_00060 [Pseudalgibacter alginicilyticus]|uniref:DUF4249 domain-containing protein n=1 Tax=Pseudalgibacter alginicilyticus TaxID=1736674 RepID=A0A0P0CK85_9FLAO|nr:DUF4249 family protein [Pseudalgibacter alginicilyticus]ALJ06667.1 hypothetical protein APS56_00060 [Pseudalgibacter alginicilyticus]